MKGILATIGVLAIIAVVIMWYGTAQQKKALQAQLDTIKAGLQNGYDVTKLDAASQVFNQNPLAGTPMTVVKVA